MATFFSPNVKPQQELPDNQAPALHEVLSVHYLSNIHERSHDAPGMHCQPG